MQRPIWRAAVALAAVMSAAIVACPGGGGEGPMGEDELFITANPRQINNGGQTSQITVTATKGDGTEGTGTVSLTVPVGALGGGSSSETLTLAGGRATTSFTCNAATNPGCTGNVVLTGTWGTATASTTLQVITGTVPDAGRDGGTDGGRDAGTQDSGVATQFSTTVTSDKSTLVANTTDRANLTATVVRLSNGQPVAGVQVNFSTNLGSFAATAGTTTIQATTDAAGKATVSLYSPTSSAGKATVTATYMDGVGTREVLLAAVSSITYVANSAKPLLGIASSGRETSTEVKFKVVNSANQAVPDLDISFEVSGVAGASITPMAKTDNSGTVTATLAAGDAIGVVIATATITATQSAATKISTSYPGIPIVVGKPSDSGFQVSCVQKVLAAAVSNPPPALTTDCTAKLVDRSGTPVGLATSVVWVTEAGSISSPVNSKPQNGSTPAADTGEAKTTFSSNGRYPPYAVTPMPGEKFESSMTDPAARNPRDMAVTVIAVVAGEEHFVDGSGSGPTAGQTNGRWDPGEWFTDLGEPLVDLNDNGVWDPGEAFIDTERIDCANPNSGATTNGRWDGPNGCWDSNTQIWRTTYIAYSGNLQPTLAFEPPSDGGPIFVPLDGGLDVPFYYADPHLMRLGPDAGYTVTKQASSRAGGQGTATLVPTNQRPTALYGGFNVNYLSLEGTTSDGGIVLGPPCDIGKQTPPNSTTSPVATRCVRVNQFTFPNYNSGIIRLTGEKVQQPAPPDGGLALPDGGALPETLSITVTSPPGYNGTFEAKFE